MKLSDFDFKYPESQVAAEPASPRDSARLMVVRRQACGGRPGASALASWEHRVFRDLPGLLSPGDCVVLNRTKVVPARLIGRKATGGRADLLLVSDLAAGRWAVLSSGLRPGMRLRFGSAPGPALEACVEALDEDGRYVCAFDGDARAFAEAGGLAPLPPYILKRRKSLPALRFDPARDREVYQTVYAKEPGSIAAPTAGLHFTAATLDALAARGVAVAWLTLHVGRGTFRPIEADDPSRHRMQAEWYRVEDGDARLISETLSGGRRVVAVGTTSTRVLETLAARPEGLRAREGSTDLYIHPGHEFKAVGALVTNFHQPRSTPLMLASAFLGRARLLEAYREAFARGYRLFSFGDAMLIL